MGEELARLRKERGTLKGTITRTETFVNDTVVFRSASKAELEVRREKLVSTLKLYENINIDIYMLDPDDKENVDEVESKYYKVLATINEALSSLSMSEKAQCNNVSSSKLPNIEISTFDGRDFTKFKPFIDLFTALIDKNVSLSDVQKLFYLRKYLKDDALSVIINLPIVNESYKEALSLLKKRFDNKPRLVSNHINLLLDLPSMQKGTAANIRSFLSEIQQQLYALKNLDQPINDWDMLLISVLSRKLDTYTNRAYHLDRTDLEKMPTMTEFISFLEKRAMALEDSPELRGASYESTRAKSITYKVSNVTVQDKTKQHICSYCEKTGHPIYLCPKFKSEATGNRIDFVKSKQLCMVCLKPHKGNCKFNFKCKLCKLGDHNTLLHEDKQIVSTFVKQQTSGALLPTIKAKLIDKYGKEIYVKALLDTGSQASLIQADLAKKLNLQQLKSNTKIIGICNNPNKIENFAQVMLQSSNDDVELQVGCHIVDTITTKLPQQYFDFSKIMLPAGVKLADTDFNVPSEIPLLLGADFYFKIVQEGQINLNNGLVLQNTLFGHIVGGIISFAPTQQVTNIVSNFVIKDNTENLTDIMNNFWLAEKVPEEGKITSECEQAENIFQKSVHLSEGRFYVDMPLTAPMEQLNLGDSFSIALQRFYSLENKFKNHPEYFQQYKQFIEEYISLGHAKVVDISSYDVKNDPVYFLSHHAVLNEDSKTTKLRVVFNGSMNSKNKVSLNDKMYNGPTVQNELFDILTLFRTYRYTLICDIEKMFRQVYLNKSQLGLINILWRDSPQKPVVCLQLQTVTYGLKASTFLSTRCLVELALRYHDEYPLASEAIMKNTYVDDVISGCDDVEQLVNLKKELIGLLKIGSFNLHKWCSNVDEVLAEIPEKQKYFDQIDINKDNIIKTLGVKYNVLNDSLTFTAPQVDKEKQHTKRQILSFIGKIFDPLGLIGPIIVRAKLFMQHLWTLKVNWDSTLPPEQLVDWEIFLKDLQEMDTISTPRAVLRGDVDSAELVGYCDASSKAIGCCLYLRVLYKDGTSEVNLLCSRSRLAPLGKTLTIPNLELNSAVLLAEFSNRVHKTLETRLPLKIILYSDSQIVLSWLNSCNLKSGKYVSKRVSQIKKMTSGCTWAYVRSADNPADLLSRGIAPQKLINNALWWQGPQYLSDPMYQHKVSEFYFQIKSDNQVKIPHEEITTNAANLDVSPDLNVFRRFSELTKLQKVLAWILRFIHNCKNNDKLTGPLSTKELKNSLNYIVRHTQRGHFNKEIQSLNSGQQITTNLSGLHPFLDGENILRVGGRLQNALDCSFDKKHPIILPKSSHITDMIIRKEHLRLLHVGAKLVLSSLSQRYWLINGIREVKKIVIKCLKCFRVKATAAKQLMGSLPSQRVTPSRPFQVTGVDFCGPFDTKVARIRRPLIKKSYVALFVCFSTKAIHVELVSDMTTEAFLACLQRFIARRGLPTQIFCDNAKTFKGADNFLKDLHKLHTSKSHKDSIEGYCTSNYIEFKYIPSYSPEFGGLWEAGVKSLKFHLKRVVGTSCLTFEELNTVIIQVESILNSRPLLPLSADVSDFRYLTPGHFLIGAPMTSYPELDFTDKNINRLKFWNMCTKVKQDFWKVWSTDYLSQLQNRPKWKYDMLNLKEGDLVIVKLNNVPSLQWPMARIVKTYQGPDGKVRVADIKMGHNGKIYNRSYNKLCPLPL